MESSETNMKETTQKIENEAVILTGVILSKPWSKSYESWNAGGGTYYVLDIGDITVARGDQAQYGTMCAIAYAGGYNEK